MAYAQKPDFVFRQNGQVHLNWRGVSSVNYSTTGSQSVRISVSNAGYTMFRGSVKSTGYPLHSPFSPSLPLPCITMCHLISTGLYNMDRAYRMWEAQLHLGPEHDGALFYLWASQFICTYYSSFQNVILMSIIKVEYNKIMKEKLGTICKYYFQNCPHLLLIMFLNCT